MKRSIILILILLIILSSVSIYSVEPGIKANQVETGDFKIGKYRFTNGAYTATLAKNFEYAVGGTAPFVAGFLGLSSGGINYAVYGAGKSRFQSTDGSGAYVELVAPASGSLPPVSLKAVGPASFSNTVDINGNLIVFDTATLFHTGVNPALDARGDTWVEGILKMRGSEQKIVLDNLVIGPSSIKFGQLDNFLIGTSFIRMGTKNNPANIRVESGGICVDDDGACNPPAIGKIKAVEYLTGHSDLAENINSKEKLSPGDVVIISETNSFKKSIKPYDTRVAGIISTEPGITLNNEEQGYPLALSGRVPVKVTNENGKVMPGDLLTTSSTPGRAMKCSDKLKCYGAVIGKALEGSNEKTDIINILVMLG